MQHSESAFGQEGFGTGEAANTAAVAASGHLPTSGYSTSGYVPWLEIVTPRGGQASGSPAKEMAPGLDCGADHDLGHGPDLLTRGVSGQAFASMLFAGQTFAGLVHDARNMVTAIDLYCDLLEEPGVLSLAHRHYAGELRLVSAASRRLLEKLARAGNAPPAVAASLSHSGEVAENSAGLRLVPVTVLSSAAPSIQTSSPQTSSPLTGAAARAPLTPLHPRRPDRMRAFASSQPVESLADELRANRNLLCAMTGHAVTIGLSIHGGDQPLEMTREDLTRVLINLARNAGEAMPDGGHLQIDLEETVKGLTLGFTDSGRGIPPEALETVFSPGYTTHLTPDPALADSAHTDAAHGDSPHEGSERWDPAQGPQPAQWPAQHSGLGLAIVRSIVAAAGGTVWAANRHDSGGAVVGAVLTLEFPLPAPC